MSEQGTPAEHVSLGDNGVIMLSEEAMAVMEGIEPPALAEEPKEATPAAEEPPKVETKRIKHNGQEIEITPDKEIELLQKGYDYDYKKAQIEQERAKLAAYQGLVSAIEASPDIKAKVAAALGHSEQPAKDVAPTFDDPIEQLKWEIRQEVLSEVKQLSKPLEQQLQMQQQITALDRVRAEVQKDPQFNEVQAAILDQIKSMPESIGRNLYLQLDQDPRAYMDMFQTVKQRLAKSQPQPKEQGTAPEPVKRETKAPILEQGNNAEIETAAQQKMNERIKELQRKSKNGDYRATGELMALLT